MAEAASRPITVYAASVANLAIACTKSIAAVITCSSARLSEGIHSVVDTGNQELLLGEAVSREIAASDSDLTLIRLPLTMHLSPHEVLLNLDIQFREGLSSTNPARAVDRIEQRIRRLHPEVSRIFIEASNIAEAQRRETWAS